MLYIQVDDRALDPWTYFFELFDNFDRALDTCSYSTVDWLNNQPILFKKITWYFN